MKLIHDTQKQVFAAMAGEAFQLPPIALARVQVPKGARTGGVRNGIYDETTA